MHCWMHFSKKEQKNIEILQCAVDEVIAVVTPDGLLHNRSYRRASKEGNETSTIFHMFNAISAVKGRKGLSVKVIHAKAETYLTLGNHSRLLESAPIDVASKVGGGSGPLVRQAPYGDDEFQSAMSDLLQNAANSIAVELYHHQAFSIGPSGVRRFPPLHGGTLEKVLTSRGNHINQAIERIIRAADMAGTAQMTAGPLHTLLSGCLVPIY